MGLVGTDYSVSKQLQAHIDMPEASASKHGHMGTGKDGSVPRGESTPSASGSTEALGSGLVGFVGMMTSGLGRPLSVKHQLQSGKELIDEFETSLLACVRG